MGLAQKLKEAWDNFRIGDGWGKQALVRGHFEIGEIVKPFPDSNAYKNDLGFLTATQPAATVHGPAQGQEAPAAAQPGPEAVTTAQPQATVHGPPKGPEQATAAQQGNEVNAPAKPAVEPPNQTKEVNTQIQPQPEQGKETTSREQGQPSYDDVLKQRAQEQAAREQAAPDKAQDQNQDQDLGR